jgi:hypothetical protein
MADDDLPEMGAALEIAVCVGCLVEREYPSAVGVRLRPRIFASKLFLPNSSRTPQTLRCGRRVELSCILRPAYPSAVLSSTSRLLIPGLLRSMA